MPGRKRVAESVYNMPVSVPSKITLSRPFPRMNSDKHIPRSTLSTSSSASSTSTNTMIISGSLVEEPSSITRLPSIYPALLSNVADAFKESIILSTKTKDSIKYKDAFDGKEAVVSSKYIENPLFFINTALGYIVWTN